MAHGAILAHARAHAAGGGTGPAGSEAARADQALMGRIAAGDRRAFEDLYRAYHPRLMRFLRHMTGRHALAEDVLNESLLVVWNRADRFNGASKLSTWIFAIAYRQALNALRRQDQPVEDRDAERRPDAGAGPETQLGQRQTRAALMDALRGLSADHRAVVDLTYYHEMGYREIAEIMACPVDTVKTRMFHARRQLKRRLAGQLADWL
jgi:RNA polymerase sigma-70 factor (ECF subfamily)